MMEQNNENFEIIEKPTMSSTAGASTGVSLLGNIPPPSALPSFMVPKDQPQSQTAVKGDSSSQAIVSTSQIPVNTNTVTVQPTISKVSPSVVSTNLAEVTQTSENIPTSISSGASEQGGEGAQWMGWLRGTVHSVGQKVAEKAMASMDTMITTLDPQMKQFINSGGDLDLIVASSKEVKISPVREAFQKTFGKATVDGTDIEMKEMVPQPVGFTSALKCAEERINSIRNSGKIHPQQPIVAIEGFVAEMTPDNWFDMSLLLLDDPFHDIILESYSQPIPLSKNFIDDLRASTPDSLVGGFSKTIGQVASEKLKVHNTEWLKVYSGVERRETLLMAAKVLAHLYRSRLPEGL